MAPAMSRDDSVSASAVQPGRQLALSSMIGRALVGVSERERLRRRLVNTLVLAQMLVTVAIAVGYLSHPTAVAVLPALGVMLLIYVAACIANSALRDSPLATYILVFGGALGVAALTLAQALAGDAPGVAQAALFFLTVVLEAGLLFAPEAVLITAGTTTTVTAAALLVAISIAPALRGDQAYLLIVYSLTLQALVGLIAWLVAQFIYESAVEAQRAHELQFAQARLDALLIQHQQQEQQQEQAIGAIQQAITRVITNDLAARAEVPDGDLSDLAKSINLVLQRLEVMAQAVDERTRMEAAAVGMMDAFGRMADPATPAPSTLPALTHTSIDGISIAMSHVQASYSHRLAMVQKLASEVSGAAAHSRDGLATTTDEVLKAQAAAGKLIALAETVLSGTQKQLDLIVRARRTVGALLPADGTQRTPVDLQRQSSARDGGAGADLYGLGNDLGFTPGLTDEYQTVPPASPGETGIAPLTRHLPSLDPEAPVDSGALTEPVPTPIGTDDLVGRPLEGPALGALVEAWRLLAQVSEEVGQEERTMTSLTYEIGVLSHDVRQVDVSIAFVRQTLDALRANADQLRQAAGITMPLPEPPEGRSGVHAQDRPSTPHVARLSRPFAAEPVPELAGEHAEDLAAPMDEEPAPGSLRASNLIDLDQIQPTE